MPRKYPPLTAREVVAILEALGFGYSHSEGGHDFYKGSHSGRNWKVTVDEKESPFDDFLLKSMMKQAGVSREQFYAATDATAKKIGVAPSRQPRVAVPGPSFQATYSGCGHKRALPLQHNATDNHAHCFVCHPELRARPIPGRCPSCLAAVIPPVVDVPSPKRNP
jgi:predicted RNA binding protein YcfA (HicA-like mRNA interferase family)